MPRTKKAQTETAATAGDASAKTSEVPSAKKPRPGRRKAATKRAARPAKKVAASKRKTTRRGKRYTDAERAKIVATAKREGLTGAEVSKRFGVSTLSYYLWRKKAKTAARKRPAQTRRAQGNRAALEDQLREAVRAKLREVLPQLIKKELEKTFR